MSEYEPTLVEKPERDPGKHDKEQKKNEKERSYIDWLLVLVIFLALAFIAYQLWPQGKPGNITSSPLLQRKTSPTIAGYLEAYNLGVDHLTRSEYGRAVLDLEDSVSLKGDYEPAKRKLDEARRLADLDAMARLGALSTEAAMLREPSEYSALDQERKIYELNNTSIFKAIEGAPAGSKVVWWGRVVSAGGGGFTVENEPLCQSFFVRGSAPAVGTVVKVYGELSGLPPSTATITPPFPMPIVEPRIIDYLGG